MCTPKLYREQQHVTTAAVGLALSFHVTVNYAFDWFLAASFTLSPPQQISVEASRRKTGLLAVKMTKRPCPFPETFSSQYKMHIGQQELRNYGVFGNKCRHEIYEKTKTLLFNGAKAVMGKICTGEETCRNLRPKGPAQTPACTQMLLRGQTLIRPDGRLTRVNAAQAFAGLTTKPIIFSSHVSPRRSHKSTARCLLAER
uniref:apoptosis regulatory protein Siva isoform X2 n=1 Tax=Monopterus albus TaxID=43700 RepID=UPI0009B4189B|nr:apoptosis regulatory protein Siva isoform X2 [Monopterus albus]